MLALYNALNNGHQVIRRIKKGLKTGEINTINEKEEKDLKKALEVFNLLYDRKKKDKRKKYKNSFHETEDGPNNDSKRESNTLPGLKTTKRPREFSSPDQPGSDENNQQKQPSLDYKPNSGSGTINAAPESKRKEIPQGLYSSKNQPSGNKKNERISTPRNLLLRDPEQADVETEKSNSNDEPRQPIKIKSEDQPSNSDANITPSASGENNVMSNRNEQPESTNPENGHRADFEAPPTQVMQTMRSGNKNENVPQSGELSNNRDHQQPGQSSDSKPTVREQPSYPTEDDGPFTGIKNYLTMGSDTEGDGINTPNHVNNDMRDAGPGKESVSHPKVFGNKKEPSKMEFTAPRKQIGNSITKEDDKPIIEEQDKVKVDEKYDEISDLIDIYDNVKDKVKQTKGKDNDDDDDNSSDIDAEKTPSGRRDPSFEEAEKAEFVTQNSAPVSTQQNEHHGIDNDDKEDLGGIDKTKEATTRGVDVQDEPTVIKSMTGDPSNENNINSVKPMRINENRNVPQKDLIPLVDSHEPKASQEQPKNKPYEQTEAVENKPQGIDQGLKKIKIRIHPKGKEPSTNSRTSNHEEPMKPESTDGEHTDQPRTSSKDTSNVDDDYLSGIDDEKTPSSRRDLNLEEAESEQHNPVVNKASKKTHEDERLDAKYADLNGKKTESQPFQKEFPKKIKKKKPGKRKKTGIRKKSRGKLIIMNSDEGMTVTEVDPEEVERFLPTHGTLLSDVTKKNKRTKMIRFHDVDKLEELLKNGKKWDPKNGDMISEQLMAQLKEISANNAMSDNPIDKSTHK